jgi:hypothetical protein
MNCIGVDDVACFELGVFRHFSNSVVTLVLLCFL